MKINYTTHKPLTYLDAIHKLLEKFDFKTGSNVKDTLWYNGKGEILNVTIYPWGCRVRRIDLNSGWFIDLYPDSTVFLESFNDLLFKLSEL